MSLYPSEWMKDTSQWASTLEMSRPNGAGLLTSIVLTSNHKRMSPWCHFRVAFTDIPYAIDHDNCIGPMGLMKANSKATDLEARQDGVL